MKSREANICAFVELAGKMFNFTRYGKSKET